jgi:RimJ/RimL family protein N-acetyltransferase
LAIEVVGGAPFVGFKELQRIPFESHCSPALEVGCRLARSALGHGYATKAARASLAHGCEALGLDETVAMVIPENVRSRRVCERLGMTADPDEDFDNPRAE